MTSIFSVWCRETGERRTGRGHRPRSKQRFLLEHLEPRTLLTATLSVNATGAVSHLSQTAGNTVGLTFDAVTDVYTFSDTEGIAPGTVASEFTYTQVTADLATLAPVDRVTQDFTSLSFDQNVQNITYDIESLGNASSFVDTSLPTPVGTPLTDTFDFGNTTALAQAFTGNVAVSLTKEFAAIAVDDSADTAPRTVNMTSGQVNFDTTPSFTYSGTANVSSLTVDSGSGVFGDTVNVTGTPAGADTTFNLGTASDTVTVVATGVSTTPVPALTLNGNLVMPNTLLVDITGTTVSSTTTTPAANGTDGTITFGTGAEIAYTNFGPVNNVSYPANSAPVIAAGATLTAVTNVPLSNVVISTFTDADTIENATDYSATVNWGDGLSSAGLVAYTGNAGGVNHYTITGTHAYTASGTFATSVIVTDHGGTFTAISGGISTTTTLQPLPPIAGIGATVNVNGLAAGTTPTAPTATAGTVTGSVPLVTFTDNPSPLTATDYTATINWGDGSAVSGGTISLAGGVFTVSGSHNYASIGTYPITVSVVGDDQQLTLTTAATVIGLTGTATVPAATAGTLTVTTPVTFTSTGTTPVDTQYTAVVDWGDGSTPSVAAVSQAGTVLIVTIPGHNYPLPGSDPLTVTVTDSQGVAVGSYGTTVTVNGLVVGAPTPGLSRPGGHAHRRVDRGGHRGGRDGARSCPRGLYGRCRLGRRINACRPVDRFVRPVLDFDQRPYLRPGRYLHRHDHHR